MLVQLDQSYKPFITAFRLSQCGDCQLCMEHKCDNIMPFITGQVYRKTGICPDRVKYDEAIFLARLLDKIDKADKDDKYDNSVQAHRPRLVVVSNGAAKDY